MLRGFDCNSVNDVCDKFKEMCQILNVGSVDLSDVVKIYDKKLFSAKVLNKHRNLLMTGRLRRIESFENVYIQKDLNYHQKPKLSERRHKFRVKTVGGCVNSHDNFFLALVKPRLAVSGSARQAWEQRMT